MLSLFCVVVCVLAQLINSTVHPAAILLRKRRVVGFIYGDPPFVLNPPEFCNPAVREEGKLTWLYFFSGFLIRFSVSRVWFLIHPSYFSLSQILHLPRTSFAAVIGSLLDQILSTHSMKRNNCPVRLGVD